MAKNLNDIHQLDEETLQYFRKKLLTLRRSVIQEAQNMLSNFRQETYQEESPHESLKEMQWITECSLLTHEQNILNAIDEALRRIDNKTYGYCEETGDPISLDRLEAYPMAILSLEAQKEKERMHRMHGLSVSLRQSAWR